MKRKKQVKKIRKRRKIELNLKKQNQNRPLAGNTKLEILNPKQVERVRLKKQTQFSKGQNERMCLYEKGL